MTPAAPTTARVYRNAIAHTAATVISVAVGIALTPFLLHTAGRADYGLWVLSQTFSAASGYMAIFGLGLQAAAVRLVAQGPEGDGAYTASVLRAALRTYLALGAAAALTVLIFGESVGARVFGIPPDQQVAAHLVFAIVAGQGFVEYATWAYVAVLEGRQRYDLTRTLELVRLAVFAAVAVVLVRAGMGAVGLAAATLCGIVCRGVAAWAIARTYLPARPGHDAGQGGRHPQLFGLARSFSIINLASVVYNLIDRTVIGTMVGVRWLADYDVIARVATVASIPANLLPTVVPAAGAELAARGQLERLRRMFVRATRHSLYLGLFVASTLMLIAPEILRTWVGPEYLRLATPLRIYLVMYLFAPVTLVGHAMAMGFGSVPPLARLSVIATAVNVVSSVVLTLLLGFPGTLVGTVLSHAVVLPAYLRYLCRAFDLPFGAFARQSLLRPYAISAVTAAAAVTLIAPLPGGGLAVLAAKAAAGGAVFAALVWLFGIDGDERRQAGMLLTGMGRRMWKIGGRPA